MLTTLREIRAVFNSLPKSVIPEDTLVEFNARYLAQTRGPMRFAELKFYDSQRRRLLNPSADVAVIRVYLVGDMT